MRINMKQAYKPTFLGSSDLSKVFDCVFRILVEKWKFYELSKPKNFWCTSYLSSRKRSNVERCSTW